MAILDDIATKARESPSHTDSNLFSLSVVVLPAANGDIIEVDGSQMIDEEYRLGMTPRGAGNVLTTEDTNIV